MYQRTHEPFFPANLRAPPVASRVPSRLGRKRHFFASRNASGASSCGMCPTPSMTAISAPGIRLWNASRQRARVERWRPVVAVDDQTRAPDFDKRLDDVRGAFASASAVGDGAQHRGARSRRPSPRTAPRESSRRPIPEPRSAVDTRPPTSRPRARAPRRRRRRLWKARRAKTPPSAPSLHREHQHRAREVRQDDAEARAKDPNTAASGFFCGPGRVVPRASFTEPAARRSPRARPR